MTVQLFDQVEDLDVRELRLGLGLTQLQLAIALDATPATVSRWERGVNTPRAVYVRRLQELLDQQARRAA